MIDEGYIKFDLEWTPAAPPGDPGMSDLIRWRDRLHGAELIGEYADLGIGYGNVSIRSGAGNQFVISGTQTGHLARTSAAHFALVTNADVEANRVVCEGPVRASSESLTHAALYRLDNRIAAVAHVHDRELWNSARSRLPCTDPEVSYGTPAMAREFERLYRETEFRHRGIAVMAGHDEGLIAIGTNVAEAADRILNLRP